MLISPFLQWEKSSASFHVLTYRIAHMGHHSPVAQHWIIQRS